MGTSKTGSVVYLAQNPTYVILYLGCTKSMGSRYAVNRFMKAAHIHGFDYELIPSTSIVSFDKSETTPVHQALKMWFPTKPPVFIVVDIGKQGRVPILLPLQQMKNLQMQLDMRPDRVLITCEALGLHHVQATQASSFHIVINIRSCLFKRNRAAFQW